MTSVTAMISSDFPLVTSYLLELSLLNVGTPFLTTSDKSLHIVSMSRHDSIVRSIILAIRNGAKKRGRSILSLIFVVFSSILSFYQIRLQKIHPVLFANLRRNHWDVNDDAYLDSFVDDDGLNSIGDMGFSGSV